MLHPTDWNIDPAKTAIFIYTWPDDLVHRQLVEWIRVRFRGDEEPPGLITYINKQGIVCARNQAMRLAIEKLPQFETFIFCDRDLQPSEASDEMFRLETDVKCCRVARDGPNSWPRPNSFHDAFWCISREALVKINPPWFGHPVLNADGTEQEGCMCNTFAYKALRAGLTIGHAGHALHADKSTWQ